MYFCPKCNYIFDITKTYNVNDIDESKIFKKVNDVFKEYEINKNLNNCKAEFKKEELEKSTKYKKLSDNDKLEFNKIFVSTNIIGAQFKCNNCNFMKEINETVLIFEYNVIDNFNSIKTIEENELFSKNPILPRTRDYICKNINCLTYTDNSDKEAVFFRDKNSYKVNYICCTCYHCW